MRMSQAQLHFIFVFGLTLYLPGSMFPLSFCSTFMFIWLSCHLSLCRKQGHQRVLPASCAPAAIYVWENFLFLGTE